MSGTALAKLELPLSELVLSRLQEEAVRTGQTAEDLASNVVDHWLRERHRQRISEEIAEFAATHGGSPLDLDLELEASSLLVSSEVSL